MKPLRLPSRHILTGAVALCAILFALAAALPCWWAQGDRRDLFRLEVELSSSVEGYAQVYWDLGRGMSETDSSAVVVTVDPQPRTYQFALPATPLVSLRLDPIDQEAVFSVGSPRIVNAQGRVVQPFDPSVVVPVHGIETANWQGEVLHARTGSGQSDPILDLRLREPLRLRPPWSEVFSSPALWGAVLGAAGLTLLLGLLPGGTGLLARARSLADTARARPQSAIVLLAVGVAAMQMWPVLFAGRSFVSPANGGYLLYGRLPTLPHSSSTAFEPGMGSDVGAMLFHHVYCPMLARDALGQGELPLWNRSSLAGVPLLGQGQAMVTDPFNLITIAADGAPWAWDLRFALARVLLAAGVGLTVWWLTRHFGASLLSVVAAGFWGYFSYRVNHPATFSVSYAPWILWAWVWLADAVTPRRLVLGLGLLIAANWIQLSSGTMKEASMLMLGLNAVGFALLLARHPQPASRPRWLWLGLGGAGVTFVLLSAPVWLAFLVSLSHSYTGYADPRADFYDGRDLVGWFEEMAPRQRRGGEIVTMPSTNLLVGLGVLVWLAQPRRWRADRAGVLLAGGAVVAGVIAFGGVPENWLVRLPLIGNIIHIGNTFSCVALILLAVLAGCGFASLPPLEPRRTGRLAATVLGLLACLVALFLWGDQPPWSQFFIAYGLSLGLAVLGLVAAVAAAAAFRRPLLLVAALLVAGPLLLWRHVQWVESPFGGYVVQPGERVPFEPQSAAVELVDRDRTEPGRVIGLNGNLFPAYPVALGWESLYGADALRGRTYRELADAGGLQGVGTWSHRLTAAELNERRPLFDLLNVTHYLDNAEAVPLGLPGIRTVGRADLTVYRSETAWPRAFFTDHLFTYDDVQDFVDAVGSNRTGLWRAGVQRTDDTVPGPVRALLRRRGTPPRAATDYHLSANTTSFVVEAGGPGVVVLTEAFFPEDFRVTLDGQPVPYFRVNHAFKGIYVPHAGRHHVAFSYWPQHFTLSLWLAGGGVLLGVLGGAGIWRGTARETALPGPPRLPRRRPSPDEPPADLLPA